MHCDCQIIFLHTIVIPICARYGHTCTRILYIGIYTLLDKLDDVATWE